MKNKIQCLLWLIGINWHMGNKIDGQCCPDFACCADGCADFKTRLIFTKAFFAGKENIYSSMLMGFLGGMILKESLNKKIYIAGRGELQ